MARQWMTHLWLRQRAVGHVLAVVAVAVAGGWVGLALGGSTTAVIGPFQTRIHLGLSPAGQTIVNVPPVGDLRIASHRGPLRVTMDVERVRTQDVKAVLSDPNPLATLPDRLTRNLRDAFVAVGVRAVVTVLAGSLLLGLLAFRRLRTTFIVGCVALGLLGASGAVAALTWDNKSILEPRYTGLLADAPALVGSAENIVTRFQSYRGELAKLATNVSRLYDTTSTLPAYQPDPSTLRLLSVADIHDNPAALTVMHSLVSQFSVDLIVDAGDLTDHGSQPENILADQISTFTIPYVYVRGNHDSRDTEAAVARQPNAIVLSGSVVTVKGLRFLGAGDPRFTPDLSVKVPGEDAVRAMGEQLASSARSSSPAVDIAVVHDPAAAPPLAGDVSLVLAGHTHRRASSMLGATTRLIVQGSTGGAGLRALETNPPTPIECSVLYFDRATLKLQAWDDITIGGLGATSAMIERHLAEAPAPPEPSPSETVTGSVVPSGTPSG